MGADVLELDGGHVGVHLERLSAQLLAFGRRLQGVTHQDTLEGEAVGADGREQDGRHVGVHLERLSVRTSIHAYHELEAAAGHRGALEGEGVRADGREQDGRHIGVHHRAACCH